MKKLNASELRAVDGGYRLICRYCGKTSGSVGPLGVTRFYLKHTHYKRGGYAMYDLSYVGASRWWS